MRISSIEGDPVHLADWAELQLLYSGGTELSLESIRTQLDFEGLLGDDPIDDSDTSDEASQSLVAEAVREIQRRIEDGGKGYPFRIKGEMIELRPGVHRMTPYAFCLMVCDRDYYTGSDPAPRMFESVASTALQTYLGGDSFRFGFPREDPDRSIKTALESLEQRTGDPLSPTYPVKATDKDLGLDVVGWKDFLDGRASKILVYMQCATGEDWPGKRGDLDLDIWNQLVAWTTSPIKAMAIPYVVSPGDQWKRSTPGLLLMDRLRISSLLPARALSINGVDWRSWFETRAKAVHELRQA